ncbi:hypothetical protein BD779DRAFT_1544431 [Infundibulicybe gibba]|nr:hypothetical protein BD779DRAFT_1544431 [Infundibulicybe gibba]
MDENQPTTPLPIACRFMPHDQWFVTHIQPNWKIKTIKLWLLSKCLNVPFQPPSPPMSRHPNPQLPEGGDDARPSGRASPITFAPGPRKRRISPIMFAAPGKEYGSDSSDEDEQAAVGISEGDGEIDDGGYEEDDEYDMDDDEDGSFVDIGGLMSYKPSLTGGLLSARSPVTPAPRSLPPQQFLRGNNQPAQKPKQPPIPTDSYTVLRYTTGQVLEDDFLFAWYDIRPYELFELHSAYTPSPYTNTATYHPSSARSTPAHIPHLPRAPQLYIAPYWEGWVRALRVVRQIVLEYAPGNQDPNAGMHMGMGFALGAGIDGFVPGYDLTGLGGGGKRERRITGRKITTKAEWGTRWVVIREGVITINRHQEDSVPTHQFSLASLMSLHGADYFHKSSYSASLRAASKEKEGEPEEEAKRIVCAKFRRISTRGEGSGRVDLDGSKKRERDTRRDVERQRPSARRPDRKEIRQTFGSRHGESTAPAPPANNKGKGRADHAHPVTGTQDRMAVNNPMSSPSPSSGDEDSSYLTAGLTSRPPRPHIAPTPSGSAMPETTVVDDGHSSTDSLALSSPVFAHSTDSDASMDYSLTHGMSGGPSGEAGHRYGYRYGYRFDSATKPSVATGIVENDEVVDQEWDAKGAGEKPRKPEAKHKPKDKAKAKAGGKKDKGKPKGRVKEKEREKEREKIKDPEKESPGVASKNEKDGDEKGEWIVLDMGTDAAYSSILRILHRHFPPPISSSFVPSLPILPPSTPTPTPATTPFSSPTSPQSPAEDSPFRRPSWASTQESVNTNTASVSSATFIGTESGPASADHGTNQTEEEPHTPNSSLRTLGTNPHPPALAGLEHHARGIFGPLPYPEWRLELVERARLSGVGDVGKAMLYFLGGHAESIEQKGYGNEGNGLGERQPTEKKGNNRHRSVSNSSVATSASTSSHISGMSDDLGHRFGVSDSGEESSELEWQGWMADLPRQNRLYARRDKEATAVASLLHAEGAKTMLPAPPQNPAEDQRRFREGKRALEPSGVVTSMLSSMWNAAFSTASLASRSSTESLTQRSRARAFSIAVPGVDGSPASASTASSHTYSHSYSQSQSRPSHGGTLYHSTSIMPSLIASQSQTPSGSGIPGLGNIPSSPLPFQLPKNARSGSSTMPRRASSAGMPIGVGGSVGRSSSVLSRGGLLWRREADTERQSEKSKRQESKGKEKERNKERPKLSVATSGAAQDSQPSAVRSPTMSTAKSILRRVRSSSSLMDVEEGGITREEKKRPMKRMEGFVRGLDSALGFGDGR